MPPVSSKNALDSIIFKLVLIILNDLSSAHHLLNHVFPPTERTQLYYAAGNYFSYRGPGCSNVKRLLYPSPDSSAYAGLGTHLTLNLAGEIRFGPDVDWLEAPMYKVDEIMEDEPDFWEHHLAAKDTRLAEAIEEVKKYLPNVDAAGFTPDCKPVVSPLTLRIHGDERN
jgi:2-hydroxyglutarate dehydrogenase